MDVTSIGNTNHTLFNEHSAQFANDRAEQRAQQKEKGQQQGHGPTPVKPAQLHSNMKIRPELINGYHGLSVHQARQKVGEVAALIGDTNPWKLAETQPVLDRTIIGGGYY